MRKSAVSILVGLVAFAAVAGCGSSGETAEDVVATSEGDVAAEGSPITDPDPADPTPEPPEPTPTAPEPTPAEAPEPTATPVPAEPERQFVPAGVEAFPGPYAHSMGDVELWFDLPERGEDIRLIPVAKSEWQVTFTVLDDEREPSATTPGFGIALAEPGATIDSVVEAIRESDNGRHSFEASEGIFAGAEATTITRVSNLMEEEGQAVSEGGIIEISTGAESTLAHLYAEDWIMESNVFERDGRVLIISYEWSPTLAEREMVLAEAAPIVESIELQAAL